MPRPATACSPMGTAPYPAGTAMILSFSVLTSEVVEFVNFPRGATAVTSALTTAAVSRARPAGLKKIAEPSLQGAATPAPARPIAHVPCSYRPYPCALADVLV